MTKERAAAIECRLMEIEAARSDLTRQLDALGSEKYKLLLEKNDIQIGMLVQDKQSKVYRVTGAFHLEGFGQPWLHGDLRKKDGTFGVNRTVYSSWKKI